MTYVWVVEANFGIKNNWHPTVFVGLTRKDAKVKAEDFKSRNADTFKVRVVKYYKEG